MRRRAITLFDPSRIFSDDFMNTFFSSTGLDFQYTNELEMYEDENSVVVKLKAPGYSEEDVEITIEDTVLTISGEVKEETEEEQKGKKYYYKEMRHGSFSRSVTLPVKVRAEEASASFGNGIITITLPKSEDVKPKKITVKHS
ncbi:MAG: Spore protein SP21 [candidate division WS6 bacterium OLB20]|uniref:Spore protein SP21 n=1 Tax=candidate division WS6 bacterium OLB20 TaxID=1617426 RepID=A0A136M018_9BACT|nr:MAG: Spore protein SP21 [candidate division WS6 bacterium OLB20]